MFKTNNQQLPYLVVRLSCAFWIFTKLLCFKVWQIDRLFPVSPPFSFLNDIPNEIHLGLFALALTGMFGLLFSPGNKYLLTATIILEFCSCMLDQNRWQPWEYQYFLTLCFAFFYRHNPKQFLNYFAFMMAIIYINSGLHKLTGGFLFHGWNKMILHDFFGVSYQTIQNKWVHYSGLLLGIAEFASGIGVLLSKNKKASACFLIGMHIFILLLISPTGVNYNFIVWPWNVLMIMQISIVFIKPKENLIAIKNLVTGYNKIPFVLIGILPFFCLLGWYDNFLSFNLYSGTLKHLEICIINEDQAIEYQPYYTDRRNFCNDKKVLNAMMWSLEELNIIAYPEERVYLDIIAKFKARNPDIDAEYHIFEYPYHPEEVKHYE